MTKKLLIITTIVVLIIVILLFLFSQREQPVINNQQPATNEVINGQTNINQEQVGQKELTLAEKTELEHQEVMVQARNFVERYSSFSTDADFANLYELKDEMTNRFWQETRKYIVGQQLKIDNEFYSISTKVLNIVEKDFSNNSATYSVSVQKQEIKNQVEKILYQNAEIKMVREQGSWKTDNVRWQ